MFDRFMELQERILAIAVRSEAALLAPGDHDVAALGQTRWEIARALREYQLFKHTRIFDPIERQPDHRAYQARRMKAECIRVGEEFRRYVLKWSVVSILDHWAEFLPAALDAIARIRAQLAKERIGVTALLEIKSAAA
ncbi:MAG TPA: hypothetical protein VK533_00280 [Sphingomonas sp.]|uniref:hypothetical protein n=1 Tax=Sphingomonas sp. TaxID=28214 RepID=UPI002BCEA8F0|nr:hypothetical protein [Sphingomonas sp.]HMI17954.1 hypothetical protein [Sphingomonas sp.]